MNEVTLITPGRLDYQAAWDMQKKLHQGVIEAAMKDMLILTEHPHTYTIGKAGSEKHLIVKEVELKQQGIPVFRIDRGGDITYHGPGQLIGYPILNMRNYYLDVHRFLRDLEEVIIRTLATYQIPAGRIEGLTGVWVNGAKIAAIGVKMSRWVTMHGFAFNIHPELSYFNNIIPCGIKDKPVTSMQKLLGVKPNFKEVQLRIWQNFKDIFDVKFEREIEENILTVSDYLTEF